MALSPGDRFGAYDVIALLGVGGMGEVYRARDTRLKRDVALKILGVARTGDVDRLARFQREAEILATLNHPNIASIYGVDSAGGVDALVLELVEGPTLGDRLARGPLPATEAVAIARQIADALDAAHERGIVHRDLKPANIKVREDGTVKVLDFGLAKAMDDGQAGATSAALTESPTLVSPAVAFDWRSGDPEQRRGVTRTGVILGTAAYMSPEQARGQAVDKRTDIWAFGCVLYEMLTGRAPFAGPTMSDTIAAILERTPDWDALPKTTRPSIRQLIERCLEKDRKLRLRDIGDARRDLDGIGVSPPPTLHDTRPGKLQWFLAGALAMAMLAAIPLVVMRGKTSGSSAPSSATSGPQLTRLTTDNSFAIEPAMSRDGTFVVYASDRDGAGQLDLWYQRTTGGYLRLTTDPSDDREPNISPDGNTVAFRSDRNGGGIYAVPTTGGDARLLAANGRSPRYSPDGKRLAYFVPSAWLNGLNGAASAMFVVDATGGGTASRIADKTAIAAFPVWSPDGRSLLFLGGPSQDAYDWWCVPIDGGAPVATGAYQAIARAGLSPRNGNDASIVATAWTNDGVLFSAQRGDSVNLWRIQISERSGRADGESLERLTHGAETNAAAAADDSGRIAFEVASDVGESLTLPLDANAGKVTGMGCDAESASRCAIARTFEAGEGPGRSSLDDRGHLLAYTRRGGAELWVKDLSTGRDRHVLTARSITNPAISHDGTKVAYLDALQSSGSVVAIDVGTPKTICEGCRIGAWFADNQRLLSLQWDEAASRDRLRAINTVDLTRVDLLETSSRIGRFDISPDERWLVFGQQRGTAVMLAPLRPGSPPVEREWVRLFERRPGTGERPCGWSPDGRLLYLLLERDGFRDLYAQRLDTTKGVPVGEPFVVAHFHDPRRRWGSSAIGSAIVSNAFVFTQVETTSSIWLREAK